MYDQKFSLEELEDMIPYEREIYIALLNEQIEKENDEYKKLQK